MAPISKKLLIALGAAAIVVALAIVGLAVWYIKRSRKTPPPSSSNGGDDGGDGNGGGGNTPTAPSMTYANGAWSGSFQITTDGPSYTIWDYTAAPNGNSGDMLAVTSTAVGNGHVLTATELNNLAAPGVKPGDILTTSTCIPTTGPIPASFSMLHISNADPTCPTLIWS
jgi:hypothetical protein